MFHPTPTVGGRLQFTVYAFQFCSEGVSNCPEAVLDYAPRGWVGELHVVCFTHLLGLQIYADRFETGHWGDRVCHLSQGKCLLRLGLV
jgi:hypothetical protein